MGNKFIDAGLFAADFEEIEFQPIHNTLKNFYSFIQCSTIDITQCHGIDVICDDEGLLKPHHPSLIIVDDSGKMVGYLAGALIFAGHDQEGETISLSYDQKRWLAGLEVVKLWDQKGKLYHSLVVSQDEYQMTEETILQESEASGTGRPI